MFGAVLNSLILAQFGSGKNNRVSFRVKLCYALGALEIELLDILQALSSTPCRTIDISFLRQINNRKKQQWNKEL
jgi:hypothetical protein